MKLEDAKDMERIMHGLTVTTSSLPDVAVVNMRKEKGKKRDPHLVLGEFKHGSDYDTRKAGAQCALYLFALLY